VAGLLDDPEHDRRTVLAQLGQGQPEQDREEQHLQQVVLGERGDDRGRDDAQQELDRVRQLAVAGLLLDRLGAGGQGLRVDVEPGAGLHHVAHDQPEEEGERGDQLEVDQGLDADPADRLQVADVRDPDHHGAEDDRCDQHLDQLDEGVAQRLHLRAERRIEVAQKDAQHDRTQHLDVEMPVPGLVMGRHSSGGRVRGHRRSP
jgi:hypothetical protein